MRLRIKDELPCYKCDESAKMPVKTLKFLDASEAN
jgi:hypothetical protein